MLNNLLSKIGDKNPTNNAHVKKEAKPENKVVNLFGMK